LDEQISEKSRNDTLEREKDRVNLVSLVEQKRKAEEKMFSIRFDTTENEEEKEQKLKELAEEIIKYENKIIEDLMISTDKFYDELNLKDINLEYLTDGRKKGLAPSPSWKRAPPIKTPTRKSKRDIARTGSGSGIMRTGSSNRGTREFSLFNIIKDFFSPSSEEKITPSSSRDLVVLEQEIATVRARVFTLSNKKVLTKEQQREMQDLQDQLKLRVAQREKISREEYVEAEENLYKD